MYTLSSSGLKLSILLFHLIWLSDLDLTWFYDYI